MRKDTIVFVCFVFGAIIALPISAQEKAPIEKLQSSRKETASTSLDFMTKIRDLDSDAQKKLLSARYSNATQEFIDNDSWKWQKGQFYFNEELTTSDVLWSITFELYKKVGCSEETVCHYLHLVFKIHVVPNSEMREWMRARDEFTSYSKEKIEDEDLTLNLSGIVRSTTWRRVRYGEEDFVGCFMNSDGEGEYPFTELTYDLRLSLYLGTFQTFELGHGRFRGSIAKHTEFLKAKTAEWVKYYMDKGPKPKPIRGS